MACLRVTSEEFQEIREATIDCALPDGTLNEYKWNAWVVARFGPQAFGVMIRALGTNLCVVSPQELLAAGRVDMVYSERERADIIHLMESEGE